MSGSVGSASDRTSPRVAGGEVHKPTVDSPKTKQPLPDQPQQNAAAKDAVVRDEVAYPWNGSSSENNCQCASIFKAENLGDQRRTAEVISAMVNEPQLKGGAQVVAAFFEAAANAGMTADMARCLLQDICKHSDPSNQSALYSTQKLTEALCDLSCRGMAVDVEKFCDLAEGIIAKTKDWNWFSEAFHNIPSFIERGYDRELVLNMHRVFALEVKPEDAKLLCRLAPHYLEAGIAPGHAIAILASADKNAYETSLKAINAFKNIVDINKFSPEQATQLIAALMCRAAFNPSELDELTKTITELSKGGMKVEDISYGFTVFGNDKEAIAETAQLKDKLVEKGFSEEEIGEMISLPTEGRRKEFIRSFSTLMSNLPSVIGDCSKKDIAELWKACVDPFIVKKVDAVILLLDSFDTEQDTKKMRDCFDELGAKQFAQLCAFTYNSLYSYKTSTERMNQLNTEKFLNRKSLCQDISEKFNLQNWSMYSEKIFNYLSHPEKHSGSYDVRIVEFNTEADLYKAIGDLPDHSQPRIEITGHGAPENVTGGKNAADSLEGLYLLAPDELLGPDQAYGDDAYQESVRTYLNEAAQIDSKDMEWNDFKNKFTDSPDGKRYEGKRPLLYSVTTTDFNGGFSDTFEDLEQFIDFDGDTSVPPEGASGPYKGEVVLQSCSTARGIAVLLHEWLGVPVTAPNQDVGSSYSVKNGRMEVEYTWSENPAANVKRVILQ